MPRAVIFCCVAILGITASLRAVGRGGKDVPVSEEDVEQAIRRGVEYLWSQQRVDGSWPAYGDPFGKDVYNYHATGPGAMAMYALLETGESPQSERMAKALAWLSRTRAERTYSVAARCCVWLAANRKTNDKYQKELLREGRYLVVGNRPDGGYNYYVRRDHAGNPGGNARTDNSCSQFGVLGVWSAQRGEVTIPKEYWTRVLKHWVDAQDSDGGWAYQRGRGTPSMTAAGVATLFICSDKLFLQDYLNCRRTEPLPALQKGLIWLDKNFLRSLQNTRERLEYFLYAVERVGLAGGYKYFGQTDWYRAGRRILLDRQKEDGRWEHDCAISDTAFALLFLVRGRQPVLFNKLQFAGDWNNRPRAVAALTQRLSRVFEHDVYWQIVNLNIPADELHDAPFLFLSGTQRPGLSMEGVAKLRRYVQEGGCLLSITECDWPGFQQGIREVYKELFPDRKLQPLPPEHPIYSCMYKGFKGRPKLYVISNGVRLLAIHIEDDLPRAWQLNAWKNQPREFEIMANIVRYTLGGVKDLPPRGQVYWPEENPNTTAAVSVLRVQHKGNWSPEPLAHERFALLLGERENIRLTVETKTPRDLKKSKAKVAMLTGTGPLVLDDEETEAIKAWVAGGGTLLIDAAGGEKTFAQSAKQWIEKAYGATALWSLSECSPVYTADGDEARDLPYRFGLPKPGQRKRNRRAALRAVMTPTADGKDTRPGVIFSRGDLTAGLLGNASGTTVGYAPEGAYSIVRNVLLTMGDVLRKPVKTPPDSRKRKTGRKPNLR
ncbi:MAG: DUF4159 domain-containing protein [Phycisphaerae bacterium]|nr:DUF4159 domain-containing protein [Phycisphaerae bacterium]